MVLYNGSQGSSTVARKEYSMVQIEVSCGDVKELHVLDTDLYVYHLYSHNGSGYMFEGSVMMDPDQTVKNLEMMQGWLDSGRGKRVSYPIELF
jgi:hypothetical protein